MQGRWGQDASVFPKLAFRSKNHLGKNKATALQGHKIESQGCFQMWKCKLLWHGAPIQQGHPLNAYSVTQLWFHTVRCKSPGFLLRILSLPLHRHHTAQWRSLVGTERSPLCCHEARCCRKATSGSRWGIMSGKWSKGREEIFIELWTVWLGVLQEDVMSFPTTWTAPCPCHFSAAAPSQKNTTILPWGQYLQFLHFPVCLMGISIHDHQSV